MTPMATKTCGFCGGPGVTKQHLWPDWLRKAILDSQGGGKGKKSGAANERGGKTKRPKTDKLDTTVVMPCTACTNGWMSALEFDVKLFLAPMVAPGEKTILNEVRRLALVRWAVKTAMLYEYTGTEDRYFSDAERRAFKERFEIPENVWIWAARYEGSTPVQGLQRRAREREHPTPAAYCLTIATGCLILQVFGFRKASGKLGMYAAFTPKEALIKLWPPTKVGRLDWPPQRIINDDELTNLDERFRLITERQ